jgi:hypothetical protein
MTDHERAFLALVAIGVFSVDSEGRIWRHRRMIAGSQTGAPPYWKDIDTRRAEISESDGYPTVLFSDGTEQRKKVFAHRVVWMLANKGDLPHPLEINHKDGIKGNTHPSNLEPVTRSGNIIHAIRVLGRKPRDQKGQKSSRARLTEEQVLEIRKLCEAKAMAQTRIAQLFGVTQTTVSHIYLRQTWTNIP